MSFDESLEAAHRHSRNHRAEVLASETCACFRCLAVFPPTEIVDWWDEDEPGELGNTAECPRCGTDSVIGSKAGFPLDSEFLSRMRAYWFDRSLSGAEAEAELRARQRRRAEMTGDVPPSVPPEKKTGG